MAKRYSNLRGFGGVSGSSIAVSNEFILPTSDGSTNQVMQTDGSGNVSWATVSGGGGNAVITSGTNATDTVRINLSNVASGNCSTVSGGFQNTASCTLSTIGGGGGNTASGCLSIIVQPLAVVVGILQIVVVQQ